MQKTSNRSRRLVTKLLANAMLAAFAATASLTAAAQSVTINVVDVGGSLALLQDAIESYKAKNPNVKFTFTKAPAPELPSKLKAMQAAGRSDVDLVLGGTDILAAGIEQNLWTKLLPEYASQFPNLLDNYLPQAREMQKLAHDQALTVTFMTSGPLLEYNPDKVKQVPTTPQELLAWCKANPNKLIYARPANSGPGRTFLMGLPYLLGDKDPKDPVKGWEKTWAYLKDLNSCIEYYPGGTGAVMKELGEGSRDMTVTVTGWDINPRALGVVPKNFKVGAFKNMSWVNDAHYMMMPKGLAAEKQNVVLSLMQYLLQPAQQAYTYDKGYFYPGPAVKNVPVTMAPAASQEVLKEYGRAEYNDWTAKFPHVQPLDAKAMVQAFRIWDQDVGAQKFK
jgi:putative spermidine/putrescine transport system substrate-binding protein